MPCCFIIFALLAPRVAFFLLVLFSDYVGTAYQTWIVPFLGFFFLPLTTMAYAWAKHEHGSVEGVWVAVVILAALLDLGVIGGGARGARRRDRARSPG